ncbi:MAG: hypothetical protein IEMM0006_2218 [bacterium]|nr:MAG: hypothetical protein IEMM0006_2218 [bacterium]
MKKTGTFFILTILFTAQLFAQDSLMNLFDESPQTVYTEATFKTTRIVLGQSVENPGKGDLIFVIQHHFGYVNQGAYEFFGLDQATIRLGFEYGVTNWLMVGVGRSAYGKTYDGNLKIKILRQSTGKRVMPVSVSYFGSVGINSLRQPDKTINYYFTNRLTYLNQLLIARKFSRRISLQLTPSLVHRNLVATPQIDNNTWALGGGGRFLLTKHTSIDAEYFYLLSKKAAAEYHNSFSIGFNIETGGHVFQLYVSNSQGIIGQNFIPGSVGDWLKGDVLIGFNITRTFVLNKPKEFRK